jgi:hypothetical protein
VDKIRANECFDLLARGTEWQLSQHSASNALVAIHRVRTDSACERRTAPDAINTRTARRQDEKAAYEKRQFTMHAHTSNENKISDGWRERASLRVEGGSA